MHSIFKCKIEVFVKIVSELYFNIVNGYIFQILFDEIDIIHYINIF